MVGLGGLCLHHVNIQLECMYTECVHGHVKKYPNKNVIYTVVEIDVREERTGECWKAMAVLNSRMGTHTRYASSSN